ncbi:MAG: decaprenyl-phosphate phosphoribosyltransferase [Deltaproteobacteria bacterium]|nr:decaprenyl-phosphate phosphoribosyltransferase [Deltaproteobacteria bacterium]
MTDTAERADAPTAAAAPGHRLRPLVLLRAMRPHQWVKNTFVLAPLLFAGPQLLDRGAFGSEVVVRVAIATLAFCLGSSATYLLNDLHDVGADRAHPVKRLRPIASGELSMAQARAAFAAMLVAALALAFVVGPRVAAIQAGYFAMNLAYSKGLKRVAYLDAVVISCGFLLRALAGGEAAQVHLSGWLIACTVLLALFLALGKRKHELMTSDAEHRAALEFYRIEHLNFALGVLAALAAGAYALYTRDPATIARFGTDRLLFTLPFALFGLWRYYQLLDDHGTAHSPTERMLRDPIFLGNGILGAVAVLAVIYGLAA